MKTALITGASGEIGAAIAREFAKNGYSVAVHGAKNFEKAVKLAEECGVLYGVIFQCRYNQPSQLVKRRIIDGKLGAVKCGRTTLTWYRPDNYYDSSDWKGTWEKRAVV